MALPKLRFGEESLELLLNTLSDGVRIVDANRLTLFWNAAAQEIAGHTAEEMKDTVCFKQLLRHVNEQGLQLCQNECPLYKTMTNGQVAEAKVYMHHKEGYPVFVWLKAFPIYDYSHQQVIGAVEIFNRVAKNDSAEKVALLTNLAFRDSLTEVFNHRYAELKLKTLLSEMQYTNLPFTVFWLHIMNLKEINMEYGNETGDKVLQLAAKTFASSVSSSEILSRWQSGTFMAISFNTRKSFLMMFSNKLKTLIEQIPVLHGETPVNPELAIAASVVQPSDTADKVIRRMEGLLQQSELSSSRILIDMDESPPA